MLSKILKEIFFLPLDILNYISFINRCRENYCVICKTDNGEWHFDECWRYSCYECIKRRNRDA